MQIAASEPTLDRSTSKRSVGTRRWRPRRRWVLTALVLLLVLALPVPWLHVVSENPPGHAWRLDGRLFVEGEAVEPPGRWSWLAVGRPPVVAELLRDRIVGTDHPPVDMRTGPRTRSPALSEPAAVAVGLRHAGVDIRMRLMVEASQPQFEGLPERVIVTEVAGIPLTDREDWNQVVGRWELAQQAEPSSPEEPPMVDFAIRGGRNFSTPGPGLPYDRIDIMDLAPLGLEAGIAGPLERLAPVSWFRNLSLGSSHGMMVALMTYADASGRDLAQTRHIAGTGGIRGDGSVIPIGGLAAKARAAKRAGADVLLFPESQVGELETFDRDGITLVPIENLDDAIAWLAMPVA